jgi:hypothetical protein
VCHRYYHTVEDREICRSRRLLGLPPVELKPPPPPLRRKIDQQWSFEAIRLQETMLDSSPRGEHFILEETIISDLRVESLGLYNPPKTYLSVPIVVQVQPYERQVVSQAAMETNVATSSGNTHISSMTVTTRGVLPLNQPSLV